MGYFAFQLPSILSGSGFEMEGSYATTQKVLEEEFNQTSSTVILLFEQEKTASTRAFQKYIQDTLDQVSTVNNGGNTPAQFKDNYAYVTVSLDKETTVNQIKSQLHNQSNEFNVSLTGGPVIEEEMSKGSQSDLKNAEMIGLPIAMIVLLLAFGGLVAASIPLVIGIITVVATMGLVYFLGQYINLSIFVLNVVPMIGIALSIDFALLYINRFREELLVHDIKLAIINTTKTAGRSIAFSGACVALGLSGMLLIQVDIFSSVAIGGIAVVIVAVLSALTFLPALLGLVGHRINKAMIFKRNDGEAKWRKFATFVMKRPILMSLVTIIILIIAILPIKDMELEIPDASALPADSETRIAYETFDEVFLPNDESNVVFVLDAKDELLTEGSLSNVESFISELQENELVDRVDSIFSAAGDMNSEQFYGMTQDPQMLKQLTPVLESMTTNDKTLLYVTLAAPGPSKQAKNWVREIEEKEMPLNFTMGGYSKFNQEIFDEINEKVPLGLLFIIITTYLILLVAFRSVLIPIKAILMNMLSLGASFGIVVWIFQEGHFGIDPTAIGVMIPVIAFAIVFGLSMDYEVFLISRIQEEYLKTKDNDFATLEGLTITSKIITAAAAIMIVVTGAFAFTEIVPVKQIGIAVALAILIDATLVRMILVPSLMKLLGDWNWWMPFRKKDEKVKKLGSKYLRNNKKSLM